MITGDDLAAVTGGTIHLMEQAENLHALGHQVIVFAQDRGPWPHATPVDIRYLPAPGSGLRRLLSYNVALLRALLREGRVQPPDAIHTRQMGYSATPLLAAWRLGVPHVLEVNGILRDELGGRGASRVRLRLIDVFARINLHRSDAYTTTTEAHTDRLSELYGIDRSRWRVMPCGVNESIFRPGDRAEARRQLDLPSETFALLHVGSLYDWRGLDVLLDGLATLSDDDVPDWQLWLVGDGGERSRLSDQAQALGIGEKVRFFGQVPYDEVPTWLRAADVGVVVYKPTRSVPGDPMKIYEYMASGLPVLAGDYPRYGGVVRAADAGAVADDTDPASMADAVRRLHADPEALKRYGTNGIETALREHTWRRRTEQLQDLLFSLCGTST